MRLVRVALAVPLMRLFDYMLPEHCEPVIGGRVLVPFGRQQRIAIVWDFPDKTDISIEQLKPILAVLDEQSLFNHKMLDLLKWAANYYHAPIGEVLLHALPVKLRQGEPSIEKGTLFVQITALGKQALADNHLGRAKKQLEALQYLSQSAVDKRQFPFSGAILNQLIEKQYVELVEKNIEVVLWQEQCQPWVNNENRLRLNKQQAVVMSQLLFHQGFAAWLLEGVTGSGKTEIYLQFIEEKLKLGQQVLVLVPEIGLTPQTEQRFRARFNVPIDVLHSNLNDSQRLQVWQRARSGQTAIVIGTRSALFTPFSALGLIILDEEHDASFKQQEGWRYHARDLAVVYAKMLDIPLLLGSATPSLESLHNVAQGKYRHLQLSQRANNAPLAVQSLVDLRRQRVKQGLSEQLLHKMKQHLQRGNQVMLFLNRRGFAPVLLCHECGWICQCQHCEKPYTYHQQANILRCHHCYAQRIIPRQCADCGSTQLMTTGLGTEQLEQALTEYFPEYKISRIDRDSTARKGHLEQHLQDIQQGKSQILIGTQMLAKGHHFPNVTLVALVNVDNALFSLDFRAEERLAQLYIQVAGRAGRVQQGEVVLQTHYPEHPLLLALLQQGYANFAQQALELRQRMGLPPFSAQALFQARSKNDQQAKQFLEHISTFFSDLSFSGKIANLQILGPMQAPHSKKAGQFRWQLLVQHTSRTQLQLALNHFDQWIIDKQNLITGRLHWSLDIDPIDLN